MWKKILLVSAFVLVFAGAGCARSSSVPSTPAPVAPAIEQPAASAPETENVVTIANSAFAPAELRVKVGTAVTWTNMDDTPHMVASAPHPAHTDLPALVSQSFGKGERYQFTFTTPGTFKYHCHLHPEMKGRIVVE